MYYNYPINNIYERSRLNESAMDYSGNTAAILKIGKIPMYVEKLDVVMDVELKPIVQCVDRAIGKIISRYKFMADYIRYNRTMYVLTDPASKSCIHKTMAVDDRGNLWLNVFFIYKNLNNDTNRVFGIIFHELMHNFLNHLERGKRVLPVENRKRLFDIDPRMLQMEDLKQNLCMDLEVNLNMVADGVVSKSFWEEMHGMYDEKYMGKMWEEIYKTDGDKILSNYNMMSGSAMDEKYYEALKEIVKALRVLNDPEATDADKEKAAAELEDAIEKLLGEKKEVKMTIRRRLKKLQKTRIKEIGEIGPYLKEVIDDLAVNPRSMTKDDLVNFQKDVDTLKNEMLDKVAEIAKTFKCDDYVLSEDIRDCMESLKDGVIKLNNPDLKKSEADKIERNVIYQIDKLLADDVKKKELAEERKKKEEEEKAKAKEKMAAEIEKKKKKHLLDKYLKTIKNLQIIHYHERASAETADGCQNMIDMIEPLLSKSIEEITKDDVEGYESVISSLRDSLLSDLGVLKDMKIIRHRDDEYLKRITDEFYKFNTQLFDAISDSKLSPTELVGIIQLAIDSIRLIGKNLHTTAKYRPSDEYRKAYKEEYDKLCKIYKELGEKGIRRELGLPMK